MKTETYIVGEIDMDAIFMEFYESTGLPKRWLRTPEQLEQFRKRSVASKLGWKRRKRK